MGQTANQNRKRKKEKGKTLLMGPTAHQDRKKEKGKMKKEKGKSRRNHQNIAFPKENHTFHRKYCYSFGLAMICYENIKKKPKENTKKRS